MICVPTHPAAAVGAGDADAALNAYNAAFLVNSGGQMYYKKALNNNEADGFWVQALDIQGAQDAYERTGDVAHQTLVNNLLKTFLVKNPPPWTWDGWNDDIGWSTLALVRGYQMTGTPEFLTSAKAGFDFAFKRGWDTQYNGGGIWEQQPEMTPKGEAINKQALSNDSLGKVACLLHQSTGDVNYLNKAEQIYDWVRRTLYDPRTGQVYTGIDREGKVDKGTAVYNHGTFVDFANSLHEITGKTSYYDDAKRTIDYVKNNLTSGGVISNSAGYLNTWADDFARGLGHFVRNNRLWGLYYPWMVQNADAILKSRRTDLNITWNGWKEQTPMKDDLMSSQCVSAVAWLQFTPAKSPANSIGGIHAIVCQQNRMAIDNGGSKTPKAGLVLKNASKEQAQKWNFRQNADNTWFITSLSSFQALDNGNSTDTWAQMIQSPFDGTAKQRWSVEQQMDGSYKIWNPASRAALTCTGSPMNGNQLTQRAWNGSSQQRWQLQ